MYLLDSVIMIDHLNGHAGAAEFISTHNNDIVLSVVTRAEVLVGYDDDMVVTISSSWIASTYWK